MTELQVQFYLGVKTRDKELREKSDHSLVFYSKKNSVLRPTRRGEHKKRKYWEVKKDKVNLKGQERHYTEFEDVKVEDDDSYSSVSDEIKNNNKVKESKGPKGIEGLIKISNPNRGKTPDMMKLKMKEESKLEEFIMTKEAQSDMARLALVRRQREIDAFNRKEELERKEEEQKLKREIAMKKLTKSANNTVKKKSASSKAGRQDRNHKPSE